MIIGKILLIYSTLTLLVLAEPKDGEFEFSFDSYYAETVNKARLKYRELLVAFIKNKATSVELVLLGDSVKIPTWTEHDFPSKFFEVVPKESYYHVKKRNIWTGEKMNILLHEISEMITKGNSDVILDHQPEYGLRIYMKDKIFFQTSISLSSENWCLIYPGVPLDYDWLSLEKEKLVKWLPK
jgi:hypothetical protein